MPFADTLESVPLIGRTFGHVRDAFNDRDPVRLAAGIPLLASEALLPVGLAKAGARFATSKARGALARDLMSVAPERGSLARKRKEWAQEYERLHGPRQPSLMEQRTKAGIPSSGLRARLVEGNIPIEQTRAYQGLLANPHLATEADYAAAPSLRQALARALGRNEEGVLRLPHQPWRNNDPHGVTELVPVEDLWRLREVDRLLAPRGGDQTKIPRLWESIRREGIKDPVAIAFDPKRGMATIADANHRLAMAKQQGFDTLPARVDRFSFADDDLAFYDRRIRGQEPDWTEPGNYRLEDAYFRPAQVAEPGQYDIAEFAKPSDIGLPTVADIGARRNIHPSMAAHPSGRAGGMSHMLQNLAPHQAARLSAMNPKALRIALEAADTGALYEALQRLSADEGGAPLRRAVMEVLQSRGML